MSVLREAIAEAMRAKMRRAGRTDGSALRVTVNALIPASEPLYAVA